MDSAKDFCSVLICRIVSGAKDVVAVAEEDVSANVYAFAAAIGHDEVVAMNWTSNSSIAPAGL